MGDRTYVTLTVPVEHKEEARRIISAAYRDPDEVNEHNKIAVLCFSEVNYGTLEGLGDLERAGIAYDSEWEAGGGYGAGGQYLRFLEDGTTELKELYDNCRNPDTASLMQLIDDYPQLRRFIERHHDHNAVLPWDNQVEWGKKYRVMQLITPPEFV